jgi:hypothetical protein
MPGERDPDLGLFLDILSKLETIGVPYMVIGAFAGAIYGVTRVTYDIDIVVELSSAHIKALAALYPIPRYYADPVQMHRAISTGTMFNIIDTERGEKADLIPTTMVPQYGQAFRRRVRQTIDLPTTGTIEIWCARPEDVIVGKLMAWAEGRSHKHETDIYEMLVFHYLDTDPESTPLDEAYIDAQARSLGAEATEFWQTVKATARQQAQRER